MKITEYFVKKPLIFWSLVVAFLVAGVLSFSIMPKLEDPAVSVKQAVVVIPYPGADVHKVELAVAQMVETELRTLPNVQTITTECSSGMAKFTVEFKMSVLMSEVEQHFDLLRRKVNDLAYKLPQGCSEPVVIDDMLDVYGIFYALVSDGYDYSEMEKYAEYISRELSTVNGVKRVNISGARNEVINITLSKETLARNGMVPMQVMTSLQSAGKTFESGSYLNNGESYKFRVDNAVDTEDEIREMPIKTPDGKIIKLGDIAKIERTYSEPQRNGFFVDCKPALAICIAMEADAIVPDVGATVEKKLDALMENIPLGLSMQKIFFQPEKVDKAIDSFMINLLESVIIVIVVLVFTMGFKSGIIIGFGLVLTIAMSFPLLLMCGTTLQRISLGAFIIAMGMLVDNAIVIMDGILIDRKRGLSPDVYLYRIGRNTALPLLGATVIAASTFIGVYLSPDSAGEYARDLFLVLCVSLLVSWVLALIQVPVCAKAWFKPETGQVKKDEVLNSPLHRFVRKTVSFLIEFRKTTIAFSFVLLLGSVWGFTKVKNLFFPDFDYNQFVIEYFLPSQSSPDRVKEDLLSISKEIGEYEHVQMVAASMGSAPALYCLVRPMTAGGDCYGELIVNCDDYDDVLDLIPVLRKRLRTDYPDAYIRFRKYNFSVSTSHPVELEFSGPDPAVLKQLSAQAEQIMKASPYVDAYSVQNNWKPKGKYFNVDYLWNNGLRAGISRENVGNALQAATDGLPVGVINDQNKMVIVNMMVRNNDGSRIKDVNDIPVWTMLNMNIGEDDIKGIVTGSKNMGSIQDKMFKCVPLSNVVKDVKPGWEETVVRRVNGRRAIEVECDPDMDNTYATPAKIISDVQSKIDAIEIPEGYSVRWLGDIELQERAIPNVMKYMPITIFLILFILLFLFNSWRKVLLIIICFPFVLCGITPSLLATGEPFTFMAIIGLMGLIGMMVKNAIVLVDEIGRLYKEEHMHPYYVVINATVSRVRPVTMASLTTILGMLPLLMDPMYKSMAITIMSGLAVGTIITLVLLPLFYTAMFHVRKPGNEINDKISIE